MADEEKLQTYFRKATRELQQTRRRLAAEEARNREPIAIVGIGCRFPGGVRSPEDLWRLVEAGTDAVTGLPTDRGWNLADRMPGLNGGFLDDVGGFDPEFFGIGPDEALAMDPQQRLLLEVSWEAFERAGIDPLTAKETRTAVYAGIQFGGYPLLLGGPPPPELMDYIGFGSSAGAASGRVSYLMGLLGAAVSVDTQCTSSLVAVHLAVKALRNGECTLALAGGASAMSLPNVLLDFQRRSTLSPDGRSKSFAAAADGVSLSEGAGMLLLERLSDARRNGRTVMAVIRGSAINQDGATNGMHSPRAQAQERVIRQALADARLTADSVDVVEGHGVGAVLGDGVEAGAVIATYGQGHTAQDPVRLGSVKSNIGHTQTVGAVAGITKMVMAMRHGVLPRTLHVDRPTTHADWSAGTVRLLSEPEPWPAGERVRRAGVSCLTLSGTNAHLLLEEPPAQEATEPAGPPAGPVPWVVSARTAEALREQAARVRDQLAAAGDTDPRDAAIALHTTRSPFRHRAVVVGGDRAELLAGLDAVAAGRGAAGVVRGSADRRGRTALLFSGGGPAGAPGAGRGLAAAFPEFAAALATTADLLDERLGRTGRPLRESMLDPAASYDSPCVAHAAGFTLGVALHRLADTFGIAPVQVAGRQIGEVAAAHAAGMLSLPDAVALAACLARAADRLPAPAEGASVRIAATEEEVTTDLDGADGRLALAAADEPGAVVLCGERQAVEACARRWEERGRDTGPLLPTPLLPGDDASRKETEELLRRTLDGLEVAEPAVPVVCTLDGAVLTAERLRGAEGAAHWAEHLHGPSRLLDTVKRLRTDGVTRFLELGPDDTLTVMVRRTAAGHGEPGRPLLPAAVLGDGRGDEARALLSAFAALHTDGVPVTWSAAFGDHEARNVELPTYPFQYQRFWLAPPDRAATGPAGPPMPPHALLGAAVELADSPDQWFSATLPPGAPARRRVHGTDELSPAALVAWMLAAAHHGSPADGPRVLRDVVLHDPLPLPGGLPAALQTLRESRDGGVRVRGLARAGKWTPLVSAAAGGPATDGGADAGPAADGLAALTAALVEHDAGEAAAALWRQGVEPSGAARVTRLWRGPDETVALVEHQPGPADGTLDIAAFDTALGLLAPAAEGRTVPVAVERLTVHGPLPEVFAAHTRRQDGGTFTLELLSEAGERLVTATGVALRTVAQEETARTAAAPLARHELRWQSLPGGDRVATVGEADGSWLVHAADTSLARRWRDQLAAAGLGALALVPAEEAQASGELPVDTGRADDVARACGELARRGERVAGVLLHTSTGTDRDGRHAAGRHAPAGPRDPHPAHRPAGRVRGGPAAGRAVHHRRGGPARHGPAAGPGAERGGRAGQGGHVGLPRAGLRPRRPGAGRPGAGGGHGARPGGPARRLRAPRDTRRRLVRGPVAGERAAGGRLGQDPAERQLPGDGRQRGDRRPGGRLADRAGRRRGAGRPVGRRGRNRGRAWSASTPTRPIRPRWPASCGTSRRSCRCAG